ncbi:hypothetical protein [Ferroacidibacillus organovorans]|uniref:hypothetical protein n=1 Tax=Ferroacidibacillus organovorans TaxID=1765683 RepID=UPI0012E8827C|nr:hypothetical protein [Ferroacidibacillus organovorans]
MAKRTAKERAQISAYTARMVAGGQWMLIIGAIIVAIGLTINSRMMNEEAAETD